MVEPLGQTSLAILRTIAQAGQATEDGVTSDTKAVSERLSEVSDPASPPWFGLADAAQALERRGAIRVLSPMAPLLRPNDSAPPVSVYLLMTSEKMLLSVIDQYKTIRKSFSAGKTLERGSSVPHHRASVDLVLEDGSVAFIESGGTTEIAALADLLAKVLSRSEAVTLERDSPGP